jgi:hypothetical protein
MKTAYLVIISLVLAGLAHAEEFVYVRSLKADLYAEPAFSARHVAAFPKGVELVKLEDRDRWFLVRNREVTGWVAKLLVSATPPRERDSAIKEDSQIGGNARRRASAVATAGAARGLAADDRRRLSQDNVADFSALATMESLSLADAEVIDFLKQGLNQ